MEIEEFKLLASVLAGFFGALFGSIFALSRTKKEKVWDEKRGLYSKAIAAMEDIAYWAEQTRANHCCEYSNSVNSDIENSLREISRLSISGSLVMCSSFHQLLVQANTEITSENFRAHEENHGLSDIDAAELLFNHACSIRRIAEEYIPKLIRCAQSELPKKT